MQNSSQPVSETAARKQEIRQQAHENRKSQADKDGVSRVIVERFMVLPEYASATTVMFYIDVRDEVRTRHVLPEAIQGNKRIIIPYCVDGELELFHLESMDELDVGMYKILEPKKELREVTSKRLQPEDLDLIMVPGVAFDRNGGRTGTAKGITTSCWNMREPTRRLWCWRLNASCSQRSPASITTSIWIWSSPNTLVYPGSNT